MGIPEINEAQVLLMTLANTTGVISVVIPEEKKDNPEVYKTEMERMRNLEQLVIIGALEDITDQCSERILKLLNATGRIFKVYEVTDIGVLMFDTQERPIN